MKITIIAGARPNFMKIAPLMRAINAAKAAGKNISARLVYTGSDEDKSPLCSPTSTCPVPMHI